MTNKILTEKRTAVKCQNKNRNSRKSRWKRRQITIDKLTCRQKHNNKTDRRTENNEIEEQILDLRDP